MLKEGHEFLDQDPDNMDARILRGKILLRQGKTRAATDEFSYVLAAAANAAPATVPIQVTGKATINGTEVARAARFGAALTPITARRRVR